MDEAAGIHEMADPPIRQGLRVSGYLNSALPIIGTAWILAGILFCVIAFLVFWRFLLHLPVATRTLFLIAGGLYVGGAIGLEIVGGQHFVYHGVHTFTYELMVALEESLEMLGVIVFLYSLMVYMAKQGIGLAVDVERSPPRNNTVSQPGLRPATDSERTAKERISTFR